MPCTETRPPGRARPSLAGLAGLALAAALWLSACATTTLPPPATPRTLLELKTQMAQRLVQAHPEGSYLSPAPARLLAIPGLEIELNADGTVRQVVVVRHPETGDEATRLAIAAVYRAAPYGNVSQLPQPWKVVEYFLFDDAMRFKPRHLELP